MSTVSNVNSSTSATGFDAAELSSQVMSQGDFLQLLVTQMTAQNPLDPLKNQDLLTQMVQFSTLQQNSNLQKELNQIDNTQSLTQANALLGRSVGVQADDGTITYGVVSGVVVDAGVPKVMVGEEAYSLSQVFAIANSSSSP
jgi:flagellar basal-body rod modification protein FlgD